VAGSRVPLPGSCSLCGNYKLRPWAAEQLAEKLTILSFLTPVAV
jgi:hypothetical protein